VDRPTNMGASYSRESSVEPSYTPSKYIGNRAMSIERDTGIYSRGPSRSR